MKILYFECDMGAAGDMLMSALSELAGDPEVFAEEFNSLGIPGVTLRAEKTKKCGISGTHMRVFVDGEEENEDMRSHHHEHGHHHSSLKDIENIITGLDIPEKVKDNAVAVYRLIAEAEAHVHGETPEHIHFHEVGTMDAVADVVGVCLLMDKLKADKVLASPVHVGCGTVKCAHGTLPVPAPATEYILRGVPVYGGEIKGELCTPTGAALLKHFVSEFTPMPVMATEKTGYGMGTKDFERANLVRAFSGEDKNAEDGIVELACNIDDMTGEEIGFATEELLLSGAADVFTAPVTMKKGRPGILLTVICKREKKDEMIRLVFKHTSTLGIREYSPKRHILKRREVTLDTVYGKISGKYSEGFGTSKLKAEYEDLKKLARENGKALSEIKYGNEFSPENSIYGAKREFTAKPIHDNEVVNLSTENELPDGMN